MECHFLSLFYYKSWKNKHIRFFLLKILNHFSRVQRRERYAVDVMEGLVQNFDIERESNIRTGPRMQSAKDSSQNTSKYRTRFYIKNNVKIQDQILHQKQRQNTGPDFTTGWISRTHNFSVSFQYPFNILPISFQNA